MTPPNDGHTVTMILEQGCVCLFSVKRAWVGFCALVAFFDDDIAFDQNIVFTQVKLTIRSASICIMIGNLSAATRW